MSKLTYQKRVGIALRKQRETAVGISQERFAKRIKMHRTYYSAIERGEKNLTLRLLVRLSEALGRLPSSILTDAESVRHAD